MLINKNDVSRYNQISKSATSDLIDQSIEDAELLDLKPLLGELLYNDLVANSTSAIYKDLLNGKSYSYDDNNYITKGLKPVLAKFTYARYIPFSGDKDTPFGLVEKTNQYSRHSEFTKKKAKAKLAEQTAYEYFKVVKDFLDRNSNTYPLWNCGSTKRTFKFNKIGI